MRIVTVKMVFEYDLQSERGTKNQQQQQQRNSRYLYTCSACEPHVKYNLICAHLCAKTFITTNIYFKTNCHTHNANKSLNNCVCASEQASVCILCFHNDY